jgi:general secretion pathway protein K
MIPMTQKLQGKSQRGSVLLIVLWTAVLLTILVTAMASKVRLSARTAFNNQLAADDYTQRTSALHSAEMELMLELLPTPIDAPLETNAEGEPLNRLHRFDGRALRLSYPTPDDMVVRIYNHAGKINLNRIPRANMQLLIEHRLEVLRGEEPDAEEVQDLLAAWTDWTDLNDIEGINGAERGYYEEQEPSYIPRNNPELDSVEELLHIRGFDELFAGINLEAAFTIYGTNRQVNLNLASREALSLLPGLTPQIIDDLALARQLDPFDNRGEIGEVVPFENLTELSPWLSNETSNYYTIFVYPRPDSNAESRTAAEFQPEAYPLAMPSMTETRVGDQPPDTSRLSAQQIREITEAASASDPWEISPGIGRQGFAEIVEIVSLDTPPRVYQINPYATLPQY